MSLADALPHPPLSLETKRLAMGLATGLAAASIGALYVVFARWGIQHGAAPTDLTALRFGVAGLVLLPLLVWRLRADPALLTEKWKIWLAVSILAGTPFGLLMFGALQYAPASHAAVFPFAAMSIMGMLISALVLGDRLTLRKTAGIAVVLGGLVLISGIRADSFTLTGLVGDAMFILAGTLWAGFGILLRRHRLDPLLAIAVIAVSALVTFVPVYLWQTGGVGLVTLDPTVLAVEAVVQGLIAGTGTLFTYARMVAILGPSRSAIFPALAPGLAALMAWPILGVIPGTVELLGLVTVIAGLLWAVTGTTPSPTRGDTGAPTMLTVYAFATPNSVKIPIALEELDLPYELRPVNIRRGAQKAADYMALNPNAKVPLLVDGDLVLPESGAILVHLAEKTGRLLPTDPVARARTFEWLFVQLSGTGPAFGQSGYWQKLASERNEPAIARYQGEADRLADLIDAHLSRNTWFAGDDYTIADIAHFGWFWRREFAGVGFDNRPHLARWYAAMEARPAVQRGVAATTALAEPKAA